MAAGVRPPLEGNDLLILATHIFPVGDRSGVDVLELLPGQALHRVVLVDDEHQRVPANGLLLQRVTVCLQLLLDGFRGFVGDDELDRIAVIIAIQAQVAPGLGRGVGGHGAPGGLQIQPGGIGHDLRDQRDAGRAAIRNGELVHTQDGFRRDLAGSGRSRSPGVRLRQDGCAGGRCRGIGAAAGGKQQG